MSHFRFTLFAAVLAVGSLLAPVPVHADAVLRSGDTFELRIGGVPNDEAASVNGVYTVDGEGNVNLPYINKLPVAGLTTAQIQALVEHTYKSREIYTNPTITLALTAQPRFVNVGGAVKSPQRVAYTADMTVLGAINAAGDFNEFADQKKVRLLRADKVIMVNCKEIRRDPSKDVKVLPGDQVQVPEAFW